MPTELGVCQNDARRLQPLTLALAGLLALAIVRLWLMPLPSSFWTDETDAAFLVRYGSSHPSLAASPQLADSIYNALPRAAQALGGFSETAYRLPSTLAMALGLILIARLGRFFVYGCRSHASFWENWFKRRPELAGWSARRLGSFGDVVVVEFDRPPSR